MPVSPPGRPARARRAGAGATAAAPLRPGDRVVVRGAGPAGLTAANPPARQGDAVTVLEGDPAAGGISRTGRHGEHRVDAGGHRFFTEIPPVEALRDERPGDQLLQVIRGCVDPIANVHTDGRNGMQRDRNQDHSMPTATFAVENVQGAPHDLWAVDTDLAHHEEQHLPRAARAVSAA